MRGWSAADVHCAPAKRAVANLRKKGMSAEKIVLTSNTIVEATLGMLPDETTARGGRRGVRRRAG